MSITKSEQRFNQLVDVIYQSVQDIDKVNLAMDMMCKEIGAAVGHYVHLDVLTRKVLHSSISHAEYSAGDREYEGYYSTVDERLPWIATGGIGEWRTDYERFNDSFVSRSEIYNDFLFKYGLRHLIVGRIGGAASENEGISFLRPLGAKEYGVKQRQFLTGLTGHWMRSSVLRQQVRMLEAQRKKDQVLLQHLPYGEIWVDGSGKIISFNQIANEILRVRDGLAVHAQRLVAADVNAQRQLMQATRLATAPDSRMGQWFAVRRRKTAFSLLVSVIPAQIEQEIILHDGQPLALIIVQDMGRRLPRSSVLRKVFDLTPTEGRLAEALIDNDTIESYADKMGVSRNTVRTHMASLFAKTGTGRQAELLRALLLADPHIAMQAIAKR